MLLHEDWSDCVKVLITGGYGFIGSHVADRLNKEGHQVFILDNLSKGFTKNVKCKHNGYILDIENKKCEEVFKTNKFDVVIHLAAHTDAFSSVDNPAKNTKVNLMGLTNMLSLSTKYKIKKFIFASSCVVYGKCSDRIATELTIANPTSPYGISKLTGEMYCQKWQELYGLNTICLRLSNVYGPRQTNEGEGGLIATVINKIIKKQEMTILGSGNQTRDFIYVEDVADAIYRCINADVSGIYNVSSQSLTSINSIVEYLSEGLQVKVKNHKEDKSVDIFSGCLDNTKFKKCTDWVPLYNLEEGTSKTFKWFIANAEENKLQVSKKQKNENNIKGAIVPYLENFLGFAILILLSVLFKQGFMNNMSTYLIFYIVLIGIVYGTKQSVLAILLSGFIYVYTKISVGGEILALIYDTETVLQLAIFILLGLGVGYTIDKKELKFQDQLHEHELLSDNYNFLKEIHDETTEIREQLQAQISASEDSFGKVFSMTTQLDSLECEKIFYSAVNIVESVMKTDKVALFTTSKLGNYLRLAAKSAINDFDVPKSIKIAEDSEYYSVINNRITYTNRHFDTELPTMMAPICNADKVVAVIALYSVEFDNITLHYKNLLNVVSGLISSAINKAYTYAEAIMDKKYLGDTLILKGEYFEKILEIKNAAQNNVDADYCLVEIRNHNNFRLHELAHILNNNLRETDYVGMLNNEPYIMLSNSSPENCQLVISRLQKLGIDCILKDGEYVYA